MARIAPTWHEAYCDECGKEFESEYQGEQFCSFECAEKWDKRHIDDCPCCGKPMECRGDGYPGTIFRWQHK